MGVQGIRRVMELPPAFFKKWYLQQLVIASFLRAGLNKRFARNNLETTSPAELPEPTEIVADTIRRILEEYSDQYIWDGSIHFNNFFARCLRTTCSSLRDAERRHRDGRAIVARHMLQISCVPPEQDDYVANRQYAPALAAAIATTSMTGAGVDYAKKLDVYATEKWSLDEIADDLGVNKSSVDSLRRRLQQHPGVRRALKSSDGELCAGSGGQLLLQTGMPT
jgi:DNA-directed RNA polymerase specialized sigma24 family protein